MPAALGILAALLTAGCGPGAPPAAPGLRGQRLEVAAVWSGVEQRNFQRVLRAFTRQTGVTVSYTSAGYSVPVFLRARLAAGRLPDVAFLPQPGLLRTYAVLMRRSAAGDALIRFLASPQAAAIWAARGGFVSPNINLGLSVYPDTVTRSIARSLLESGSSFRFSLSDLTPAGFGGTEGQGMRRILQQFLLRRDAGTTAARLEQAARKAYAP